jgi:thiol:disulfide interchange protein
LLSGIEDPDNNTVLDTFDLIAVPTIFFVDGNNTVTWIHVGSTTYDKLRDMADNYLQD